MIRFKGSEGIDVELFVRLPRAGLIRPGYSAATPEDMARAYHAMTDDEIMDMAMAYARLPHHGGLRSFDESYVKAVERLEAENAELRVRNAAGDLELQETIDENARLKGQVEELAKEWQEIYPYHRARAGTPRLQALLDALRDTAPAKEKP